METFPVHANSTDAPLRLFIAVTLPDAVRSELTRAQAELRAALPRGCVRWAKPEQFHLTLRFLGDVEARRIDSLVNSFRGACAGFSPLHLRSERIGCFPDLRYPRVIWAWVHDEGEQLPRLQSAIEQATGAFTVEKPEKKFTGHITLGRCQGIKRPQADILSKLASEMVSRRFGDWTAGCVELIRSELSPTGARYTTLTAINLAPEMSSGKLPPA